MSGTHATVRRLAALRAAMAAHEPPVEALLVGSPHNRRYLTGFSGSAGWALVTPEAAVLLVDFRYVDQARAEAPAFEVVEASPDPLQQLGRVLERLGVLRVGCERDHVTLGQLERLRERAPGVEWLPVAGVVERLRAVKDEEELAAIRRAAGVAERAFREVLAEVRPGIAERDLAAELEYRMRRAGADGPAFDTIVASGPRSALPHGRAGERRLAPGDFVTFDFGARVDGYCSDCTRTVVLGRADEEQRRVYGLVRHAQEAALAAVRAGVRGREVDAAARGVIEAAGMGERFGHGTGHGVGLEVHEAPRLGRASEDVLAPGMVVTVEPGVYISGWGGVRIEDLVVVREDGAEVLTPFTKELLEL